MIQTPFVGRAIESPGFINKLLGRLPKKNALAELNNRLVEASDVRTITLDVVEELNTRYQIDLQRSFDDELKQLYRSFLFHCLADREFSEKEVGDLWHLKGLFGISDRDHERLYEEAALEAYKKGLNEVLLDGRVTAEEKASLERLSAYLKIPEKLRDRLHNEIGGELIQRKANQFTADNQLSPDEETELYTLSRSLGIQLKLHAQSAHSLETMRMMWRIKNAPLPVMQTSLNLQRGELCHFSCPVDWHEHRKVTTRVNYGGASLRIRICKGVYWNTGSVGGMSQR
jgi:hypothetical protein